MARPRTPSSQPETPKLPAVRGSIRGPVRTALALEEAGELQEAARLFEYAGHHAQAASLRLEHADTLRDEQQRLSVLREGCARNPASSEQGRALHRALGETLLRVAEGLEPGARKRALILEAAHALEAGQRGGEAGRLYERLGLLSRAAKAYTDAGDIERLERVHRELEARDRREAELRALEREVDSALQTGRRKLARELILEHVHEAERRRSRPSPTLQLTLAELARTMVRERMLRIECAGVEVRVVGRERLRIGRAPECELQVEGAAISRQHAELILVRDDEAEPTIMVRDLGSRSGTFIDGDALLPADDRPLPHPDPETKPSSLELALGIAASIELVPLALETAAGPEVLLRTSSSASWPSASWLLFCPLGGVLWLDPDRPLPLVLDFGDEHTSLSAESGVMLHLNGLPVGAGASIDLCHGDELRLTTPEQPELQISLRVSVRP